MLDFTGMTTRRICELINKDAHNHLTDKQFLEKEIAHFMKSHKRQFMIAGEKYFCYGQDVLNKKRLIVGDGGQMFEDKQLPNNRFIDNQYAKMVNQKVNYIFSKPITFECNNEKYSKALRLIFDKKFHRTFKNLAKDVYNCGIGWLYPYYDENGAFKFQIFKPYEVLPFWKDEAHTELDFAVRIYNKSGYESDRHTVWTYVEVYDTQGIHKFEWKDETLVPDYQTYYFDIPNESGELIPYTWGRVPLIPFKSDTYEISLLRKCKSLQDGINTIMSNFADGIQENANCSVLVLKNYDGENLGEFRRNLAQYKAVKVRTVDGGDGGIESLQIEVNTENYKTILSELKKALIKNCAGYDIDELKSSGSPNEMTIKSVYSDIDLDANEIETEFQASFEDLLYFVNAHLNNIRIGNFMNESVNVIFNRDMMVNESQVINDINASMNILSKKTLVAMHPYVTDVNKELEQIEEERSKEQEEYSKQFGEDMTMVDVSINSDESNEEQTSDR